MVELIRLKTILSKLSENEIVVIRKNILYDNDRKELNDSSKKLLDILIASNNIDEINISNHLYGKVNLVALKKLLQRLTVKVLDLISSKEILLNNLNYDNRSKEAFNIRRKILYYDILNKLGVSNYALTILNQVISTAKKIEYYDYLIIALEKKLAKMSLSKGLIEFNKVYKEIVHFSDCNSSLKNSKYILRRFSSIYEYNLESFDNEELLLEIKKIKKDYERTNSKSLKNYIFYLFGIYYNNLGLYIKCKNNFKSFYNFLISNPNIANDTIKISCLLNISENDTLLWNFESSLESLKKIILYYSKHEYNNKLVRELIFFNYFFMGDLNAASENIENLLDINPQNIISEFVIAKRYFYLASIYTIKRMFVDSNKILANCRPLDKDKQGWNLGLRLLSIINNIELGKLNFVESQIENLRKHLSRVDNKIDLKKRYNIICKILIYLVSNSFDFDRVSKNYNTLFTKLQSRGTNTSWVMKSPELLIFHEWFDSKVKGIPYDHTEIMKRLRKNNKLSKQ